MRVTSWLAGWVDYMFAIVLVAGRWLRAPFARASEERVMLSAFAPAMTDSFATGWHETRPEEPSSSGFIKAAEIVMLSLSFFLAAHLLSGGTSTVTAPNLNPLGLLPDHARAETMPVPAPASREVTVPAGSFIQSSAQQAEAPAPAAEAIVAAPQVTPVAESSAALAPAAAPQADAAAVEPVATPAPPAPAPTPAVAEAQPVPVAAAPAAAPADRYLSYAEVHAAAIAAGWPAALLSEVEAVAWCESRFHTTAVNYNTYGLMQMMGFWFTEAGLDPEKWWDPVTNFQAALFAYNEHVRNGTDGWGPWSCKP